MSTIKISNIYNGDSEHCSKCIKAGYFKMGVGNLLYHPNDGFTAPCVLEYELEEIEEDEDNTDTYSSENSRR